MKINLLGKLLTVNLVLQKAERLADELNKLKKVRQTLTDFAALKNAGERKRLPLHSLFKIHNYVK